MALQVYLAFAIVITGGALAFAAFVVAWVVRPKSQEEKIGLHEGTVVGAAPDSVN